MKQMTFVAAMRDFFGMKPGETLQEFMQEMKALTQEDREDFRIMLGQVGYTIIAQA